MKILIIGNCQSRALSMLFNHFFPSFFSDYRGVFLYNTEQNNDFFRTLFDKKYDIILSHVLHSEQWGKLQTSNMREHFKDNFFTITNIYYTAFHPDCSYHIEKGTFIQSPLTNYNSKSLIDSFKASCDIKQAANKFLEQTFDIQKIKNESSLELLTRDQGVDIMFAQDFLAYNETNISMLSFNHPTKQTMLLLLKKITQYLHVDFNNYSNINIPDLLENGPIFPVVESVAKELGVQPTIPLLFKTPSGIHLTLEEFVTESFAMYKEQGVAKVGPVDPRAFYECDDDHMMF